MEEQEELDKRKKSRRKRRAQREDEQRDLVQRPIAVDACPSPPPNDVLGGRWGMFMSRMLSGAARITGTTRPTTGDGRHRETATTNRRIKNGQSAPLRGGVIADAFPPAHYESAPSPAIPIPPGWAPHLRSERGNDECPPPRPSAADSGVLLANMYGRVSEPSFLSHAGNPRARRPAAMADKWARRPVFGAAWGDQRAARAARSYGGPLPCMRAVGPAVGATSASTAAVADEWARRPGLRAAWGGQRAARAARSYGGSPPCMRAVGPAVGATSSSPAAVADKWARRPGLRAAWGGQRAARAALLWWSPALHARDTSP
ncbi:hypothetical protein C8R47DRAFT_1225344 [Mycena vitilis]|nr:hypothetical protein C8R47DRAFT_1225344 [Mycena vitilis]